MTDVICAKRTMTFQLKHIGLCLALAFFCSDALAEDVSLPGGASTLREAHGDWSVTCAVQAEPDGGKVKICAFSQEQFQTQTRQRALAVELRPAGDGAKGTLVLPFGLALQHGVVYQLDDGQTGALQFFRTCLPVGCIIDVNFDAGTVASLKTGKMLGVRATTDGGQEMTFSISLAGFTNAFERTIALLQ